jgi:hypothetical protein
MEEKRQDHREGTRRIMVNTDEELIEALKEINETLAVKETPKVIETPKANEGFKVKKKDFLQRRKG